MAARRRSIRAFRRYPRSMRTWRAAISRFIWQLRNARYQRQLALYAEQDERDAAHLEQTKMGAGDRVGPPL